MSVCEHDWSCPGYGELHEAKVTYTERLAMGREHPPPISVQRMKREARAIRKAIRDADL